MTSLKFVIHNILLYLLLISDCEGGSHTESGRICISSCKSTRAGTKPTCYYSPTKSEACIKGGDILEYFTTDGQKCNGICGKFGANYNWCFDRSLNKKTCDDKPKLIAYSTPPNIYNTRNEFCQLQTCNRNNEDSTSRQRGRRQINNVNPNNQGRVLNEVDNWINDIFAHDNFVTIYFNNQNNPIVAVATVEAPEDLTSRNANHHIDINIPIAMRATIRHSHMKARERIPDAIYEHMKLMDREDGDEAGHLLANSLGGPNNETYNFAPQSPMLNHAVRARATLVLPSGRTDQVIPSCWWDVEGRIRKYLNSNRRGSVSWGLVVHYRLFPTSRRPTGFSLSVTFLDDQGRLVNFEGGASFSYYFPNVPTAACSDINHPWFSHWTS